jgi:hypothetical protein
MTSQLAFATFRYSAITLCHIGLMLVVSQEYAIPLMTGRLS